MRMVLPSRLPNLNAYAERWVRSVKEEVLSRLMLFGESTLRRVLNEYVGHYHHDRNHQGTGNVRLFPSSRSQASEKPVFRVHYNAVDRHSVLRYTLMGRECCLCCVVFNQEVTIMATPY